MDGLILGIDLCDEYTQVSCVTEEKSWTIPTVICKHKTTDEWYIGEEAYAHTLIGDGIIVDKLLKLLLKDGTATLGEIRYTGLELLELYIKKVLEMPEQEFGTMHIKQLVFTVRKLSPKLLEALYTCARKLEIPENRIHVLSHTESFVYYILSQKRELWNNLVGMFDLSEGGLCYYEMKVNRGMKKTTVVAEYENLEEGFNLDILETVAGARLADKILCSCGERLMSKKLYSSVFLCGKGFRKQDWAGDFMKMVCSKRRVYMESELFAKGAAYKAADYLNEKTSYPFTFICEGRLQTTVSIPVQHKGEDSAVVVAAAGDNWYEKNTLLDVIPDNQDTVDLLLTSLDTRNKRLVKIPLEGFPKRPNRTTKVRVKISFLDDRTMEVVLKDQGFGELFPATETQIRQEVML
ncbi:MAG: DUF5716 family protein [Lachnospiraceae bacterium]